jgi:hypothetical protein
MKKYVFSDNGKGGVQTTEEEVLTPQEEAKEKLSKAKNDKERIDILVEVLGLKL